MSKIACELITWGNITSSEQMKQVLNEVKSCGYDGVEMGGQFIGLIGGKAALDAMGLRFTASHTGGDYRGKDLEMEVENMKKLAEDTAELGGEFVFISNCYFKGKTADDYKFEAELYNRFGEVVKQAGLEFCYHNHNWEFKQKQLGFNTLLQGTDPELVYLVPDFGWITRSDIDPVDFIQEYGSRIRALHFKDFTFDEQFTELGTGIVDFEAIYQATKDRNMWIVAEQDRCAGLPLDSAKMNIEYIRSLMR